MDSQRTDDRLQKRVESMSLIQNVLASTVSTLEPVLNSKIQEANARRKEDTETTKGEFVRMEARVTCKLTDVPNTLKDHDAGLIMLHEGQVHLEHNLKMLMTKMGVTPSNTLSSDAPEQLPIANVNKAMKE